MFNPFFYINFTEFIVCFLFMIFLILVYISKKNINNSENIIYKNILFWTSFSLILSIFSNLIIYYNNIKLTSFCNRLFYGCVVCWLYFLLLYLTIITNEHRENFYNFLNKNIKKVLLISYLFLGIVYSVFLINDYDSFVIENGILVEISGFLITYYYVILISLTIVGVSSVIINHKNTSKKKLLPFYIIIPVGLVAIVFGILFPRLAFIQTFFTLISYLMYHTIENPDVKMLNELELAKNAAEKSNNAKSEFLSSMSHELRTPLNAIIGLTDIMSQSNDIDELHSDLDDIKSASVNLLELVDGIFDINRLESNDVEIHNSYYNLKELLNDLIIYNKNRIGSKNIEFKSRIADDLPDTLYGDKEKIRTIINNLVSNAIKYTDEGLVELDVSCLHIKDRFNLRIVVSDTGRGIKEEDLDKLFDKFYRSEENRDSSIEGTGLGLSITKSLVELMDGKITVNSNYGEGTSFTVTIYQKLAE